MGDLREPLTFKIPKIDLMRSLFGDPIDRLPERFIINRNATILFWKDGTKTIVKKSKEDEHNPRLAFLTAYFQKHSGLSKNKANKFLDGLATEEENEVE